MKHNRTAWLTRSRALSSLEHRDWRKFWFVSQLWHLPFWMDYIILGWVVLEKTDSPFLVALVGAFRLLPMGTLGFVAGNQADRWPRKRMLMGAQFLNFVLSAGMGVTLFLDLLNLWQMYLGAFLIGIAWAIDYPVRHSIIRDVVPEKVVVNAMAINVASWMGSAMVGRWVAGWMLDVAGPGEAYFFIAISVLLGLLFVIRVPVPSPRREDTNQEPIVKSIVLGLKYVWRNRAMRGLLMITLAANTLVFPHIQLHPVFARDVYGVGGTGLGFMSGMDGMGSMIGAVVIAALGSMRYRGEIFIIGSLILGVGVLLFSFAPVYWLALLPLLFAGLGQSGFTTMQTTIATTVSSPEMRGRAMGAVAMAIGSLPLGMLYMGGLAEWIGVQRAVTYSSIAFLAVVLITVATQPGIRRVR